MIFTRRFWRHAAVNAARTFAQSTIATLGGSAASIWSLNWTTALGIGFGSAVLSVLMTLDRIQIMPPSSAVSARVDDYFDDGPASNPAPASKQVPPSQNIPDYQLPTGFPR